jgi:hypothetical protein
VYRETLWGIPFFLLAHLGGAFLVPATAPGAGLVSMLC